MAPSPLFMSSSGERPSILTISFADDPAGSLGAQLKKYDSVSACFALPADSYREWHDCGVVFIGTPIACSLLQVCALHNDVKRCG